MTLRRKILSAVAAAMGVFFLLLVLTVVAEQWSQVNRAREREARLVQLAFEAALGEADARGLSAAEALRLRFPPGSPPYRWALLGPDGKLVASSGISGERTPEALRRAGLSRMGEIGADGPAGTLWARPASEGESLIGSLGGMLAATLVGVLLLIAVLYAVLDWLVLAPVEDLARASRLVAAGGKPGAIVGKTRVDEIGDLVRSFETMAGEVAAAREELEERVKKATAEYRRAQERLAVERRLAATGKLAAGVAHAINNPLGGMINAARSLSRGGVDESTRAEYLQLIEDGLARVQETVRGMLRFARKPPKVERIDLAAVLRRALSYLEHRVRDEGVELRSEIADGLPEILGDEAEIEQLFLNILANALDAMRGNPEEKEKALRVDASAADGGVTIAIADTGPGMSEEVRAQAFDIFFTTKAPPAPPGAAAEAAGAGGGAGPEGTGLGLAVALHVAQAHGGGIELESRPGEGTTVTIRLPAAE